MVRTFCNIGQNHEITPPPPRNFTGGHNCTPSIEIFYMPILDCIRQLMWSHVTTGLEFSVTSFRGGHYPTLFHFAVLGVYATYLLLGHLLGEDNLEPPIGYASFDLEFIVPYPLNFCYDPLWRSVYVSIWCQSLLRYFQLSGLFCNLNKFRLA